MVGIIPKPIKKIPSWQNKAFYGVLGLLGLMIIAYSLLFYFEGKNLTALQDSEDKLAQVGTKTERALAIEVLTEKKRISDFSILFKSSQNSSSFFTFLEEICHPQVQFSELNLDIVNAEATLLGQTDNFQILEQQIIIFKEQDLIQNVSLSNLTIGEEGEIEFGLSLSLDQQLFQ